MAEVTAKVVTAGEMTWPEFAIRPEWIQREVKDSRGAVLLESGDGAVSCGQWCCAQGIFTWEYETDEFVLLLEGEVVVRQKGGEDFTLQAGDMAYFPRGLTTTWEVIKPVRKVFFVHAPNVE